MLAVVERDSPLAVGGGRARLSHCGGGRPQRVVRLQESPRVLPTLGVFEQPFARLPRRRVVTRL